MKKAIFGLLLTPGFVLLVSHNPRQMSGFNMFVCTKVVLFCLFVFYIGSLIV